MLPVIPKYVSLSLSLSLSFSLVLIPSLFAKSVTRSRRKNWSFSELRCCEALGTGSDMGGQSNASLMRSVWRSFGRAGARRMEVPHWQGSRRQLGIL